MSMYIFVPGFRGGPLLHKMVIRNQEFNGSLVEHTVFNKMWFPSDQTIHRSPEEGIGFGPHLEEFYPNKKTVLDGKFCCATDENRNIYTQEHFTNDGRVLTEDGRVLSRTQMTFWKLQGSNHYSSQPEDLRQLMNRKNTGPTRTKLAEADRDDLQEVVIRATSISALASGKNDHIDRVRAMAMGLKTLREAQYPNDGRKYGAYIITSMAKGSPPGELTIPKVVSEIKEIEQLDTVKEAWITNGMIGVESNELHMTFPNDERVLGTITFVYNPTNGTIIVQKVNVPYTVLSNQMFTFGNGIRLVSKSMRDGNGDVVVAAQYLTLETRERRYMEMVSELDLSGAIKFLLRYFQSYSTSNKGLEGLRPRLKVVEKVEEEIEEDLEDDDEDEDEDEDEDQEEQEGGQE